jgi:hypothetical protein
VWSLEQEEWGTLSTTEGNRTVYTSAYDPAADTWQEHQVITVTSYINKQASKTNGTNFTDYQQTAEAIITHQTAQVIVNIEPPNAAVDDYGSVTFTASGANRYSWSLQQPTLGHLTASQGATTTYTSTYSEGEEILQILTCTTDRGTASAHIVHNPEKLTITPSSYTLEEGDAVALLASGGSSYSWGASGGGDPNNYTLDAAGSQAVVTQDGTTGIALDDSVKLVVTVESDGQSANATIHLTNPSP